MSLLSDLGLKINDADTNGPGVRCAGQDVVDSWFYGGCRSAAPAHSVQPGVQRTVRDRCGVEAPVAEGCRPRHHRRRLDPYHGL
jgi:hypothetical protein